MTTKKQKIIKSRTDIFYPFYVPYKLPETHRFYMTYGSLLPTHYPLPTDYRNHGVVLSPRIKFSAVGLCEICNRNLVDLPPVTASTHQSYLVEFHNRVGTDSNCTLAKMAIALRWPTTSTTRRPFYIYEDCIGF